MMIRSGKSSLWVSVALFGFLFTSNIGAANLDRLIEDCNDCHGKDGASTESDVPIIGGFSPQYIVDSLIAYKAEDRPCPEATFKNGVDKGKVTDMCAIAKNISENDVTQLADFYAGKPFVRAQQTADPALAAAGQRLHERNCEKCHTEGGTLPEDDNGILAGQWMPYLKASIEEYISGKRPMPKKMKPKMEKLQQADFDALVNYYGSFK
jgi:cytochrome subunit of sulfide dehydrogenase